MKLIFVGGIHGAGKTSLCQGMARQLGAVHYSAGQLIASRMSARQTTTHKSVADVDENQRILISAINEARPSVPVMLLDGHFSVLSPTGEVQDIPVAVFQALHPCALTVLDTEPEKAADRLRHRDGTAYSLTTLRALREREIGHAATIGQALKVPLVIIPEGTLIPLFNLFTSLICD